MKISDLIKELQYMLETSGDLMVESRNSDGVYIEVDGANERMNVDGVNVLRIE